MNFAYTDNIIYTILLTTSVLGYVATLTYVLFFGASVPLTMQKKIAMVSYLEELSKEDLDKKVFESKMFQDFTAKKYDMNDEMKEIFDCIIRLRKKIYKSNLRFFLEVLIQSNFTMKIEHMCCMDMIYCIVKGAKFEAGAYKTYFAANEKIFSKKDLDEFIENYINDKEKY
ncbi:hypothetical protein COBT_000906 [Conglomerata obtusa]